ncbi:hypothetical protein R1sor_013634 [Riccia sorocarpa]|uniref:Uncharacterized protein n=1 Tax=Riccia sorocarpa TaxID=122646 RepID=A0ABD3HAC7_9MARC
MDERRKRTLGLLLFLTVQVVTLAVPEHQRQMESLLSFSGAGPSFTTQMLIPVLAMWESMHTAALVAYLKRRRVCRTLFEEEEEDSGEEVIDEAASKRRKLDVCEQDRLADVLMSSSRAMHDAIADHVRNHIECNAHNSEMDRSLKREQSNQLVSVLGELAEAMAFIADKMMVGARTIEIFRSITWICTE